MSRPHYRFGRFELEAEPPQLSRDGVPVPVQELPLRLLLALVERAGETVDRDTLRRELWPPDVHVDFDNSLNAAMSRLREALGDSAGDARYVATEPRRGWRFVAPVERRGARSGGRWRWAAALVFLAVGGAGWLASTRFGDEPQTVSGRRMLAVLPLQALGAEGPVDLAAGLTEELISRLGSLSPGELGVIARSSVEPWAARRATVGEVGRELGVGYVLEGSVRHDGERVRISTRLVRVDDESLVWSASFDRVRAGALSLQSEIARSVGEALALELLGPDPEPVVRAASPSEELCLRGRFFLDRATPDSLGRALELFDEATRVDPALAAGWRGLAETWATLAVEDVYPPREAFPRASRAVARALELSPRSAEALATRGRIQFLHEWDWPGARRSYESAISSNPSLARARRAYAAALSALGRHAQALEQLDEARRLDPLSLPLMAQRCWARFLARQYAGAEAECAAALDLEPRFLPAHDDLKWIALQRGDGEAAVRAFARVVELEGEPAEAITAVRERYRSEGTAGLHRLSLRGLEERAEAGYESAYDVALEHAALGEAGSALSWLERSFEARETDLVMLGVDPRLDPIRSAPGFARLVERVGLIDPSQASAPTPAP